MIFSYFETLSCCIAHYPLGVQLLEYQIDQIRQKLYFKKQED